MTKKQHMMNINGKIFEVKFVSDEKFDALYHEIMDTPRRSVYDVYGRCSDTKKKIWDEWEKWADFTHLSYFTVLSYNGFKFTIGGVLYGYWARMSLFKITSEHNYIYFRVDMKNYNPIAAYLIGSEVEK